MKKLFLAVRHNDFETVKQILNKKPEVVNCIATPPPKKDKGQSPLQVAIKVGNRELAHYLIDMGADVNHMEPDDGLSWKECYRCPLLFDAIIGLFFRMNRYTEAKAQLQLISRLLEAGADPNKEDNRGANAWDKAIKCYWDVTYKLTQNTNEYRENMDILNRLLDLLYKHNADILNLDRIATKTADYYLFLRNLILNRDDLYGVTPEDIEDYKKCYFPIIPMMKPYYKINNHYYENVSENNE